MVILVIKMVQHCHQDCDDQDDQNDQDIVQDQKQFATSK